MPRVRSLLVLGALALSVAFAFSAFANSGTSAPSPGTPAGAAKPCPRGFVHGVIRGAHKCLRRGQRCKVGDDRLYHRYRFHCHNGRLTGGPRTTPSPAPSPAGRIVARIPLDGTAYSVAVGEGAVWTRVDANGSGAPELLERIDPSSNGVVAKTGVGEGMGLGIGDAAVWAPNTDRKVTRVDVSTNSVSASIALPFGPETTDPQAVTTTPGVVWVGTLGPEGAPGAVVRVDPRTNSVVASLRLPGSAGALALAVGAGALWVNGGDSVVRIDPASTSLVATISTPRACGGIAADESAVWVATSRCTPGQGLVRIDPRTNAFVSRNPIAGAEEVALGFGSVWLTTGIPGRLLRIDPTSDRVLARLELGRLPGHVAIGFGAVWVAIGDELLRIEATS